MSRCPFNPSIDEPIETRQFACMWELLRRNPNFQEDARIWLEAWNERESLLGSWSAMTERRRRGDKGQTNKNKRTALSEQLSALQHGTLPFVEEIGPPFAKLSQTKNGHINILKKLREMRSWKRAGYVCCALRWMLPPVKKTEAANTVAARNRLSHGHRSHEYCPYLSPKELVANKSCGPLRVDMEWPKTPPGFREDFIRELTAGGQSGKVELFDFGKLGIELHEIANLLAPTATSHTVPLREVEQARLKLQAIAIHKLTRIQNRFKCFMIPDGVRYSRSHFDKIIAEIETQLDVFEDKQEFPKTAFLGRENQWEAFLMAEAVSYEDGQFNYRETSRHLYARHGKVKPHEVKSRSAGDRMSDVRDLCRAIQHWISCVYPQFQSKPFVGRKGRKTGRENSL